KPSQAMSGNTHFAYASTISFALKAGSESLEHLLKVSGNGRFPIDLTTPTRAPKHRRHARGGLRPMIAVRVRKYVAHGMDMQGDTTGAPWKFSIPVTRRPRHS